MEFTLKLTVIIFLILLPGCAAVPFITTGGGAVVTQRQLFGVGDEINELRQRIRILEDGSSCNITDLFDGPKPGDAQHPEHEFPKKRIKRR